MLNTHLVKSWLRHTLTAKNRHGLHSPFIYRLADQVLYDGKHVPDYDLMEQERRRLLADERIIRVTDLGAGSQYGNGKQKKVSDIASRALKSPKLAQLIYRLARDARPRTILELGTCLGITTAYLARAVPDARVITIEGCPETAAIAREGFARAGLLRKRDLPSKRQPERQPERQSAASLPNPETAGIEPLTGNFDDVLPELLSGLEQLDLLFIDGNHRKAATLNYFEWSLPRLHEHSMVIFDDIHWSKGMEEAWKIIQVHPAVTVTADLFHIGLVFFRKGQAKEHFRLRV